MTADVRRPDITLFVPELEGGGAERIMVNLAGGIAERGIDVDLLVVNRRGPYVEDVPETVRLVELEADRTSLAPRALRRYCLRSRSPVLITALHHGNLLAILTKELSRLPVKVVPTIHNTFSVESRHATSLRDRVVHALVPYAYRRCAELIAVSHAVADDLVATCHVAPDRVRTIYNPVVTPEFLEASRLPVRHRWFAPDAPPVVLAIGRLKPQKDFPTLIRAFDIVRSRMDARLVILGEGPARAELLDLVGSLRLEGHVDLPGFVEDAPSMLRQAGAFVLSSRWEGLPTVLIEALAVDTPIVSTDCRSGPREILRDGTYGRLVGVGDTEAMAAAIVDALRAERPRRPREAWAPFSKEAAIDAYLDVAGWEPHA